MVRFITQMRQRGIPVERTCMALGQAGIRFSDRAYRAARARGPSPRQVRDERIKDKLRGLHTLNGLGRKAPESMYGVRKMWVWLQANGFPEVARCTVARLMAELGYQGIRRGKGIVTTRRGKDKRPEDLVNRDFTTSAPDRTWVVDFTYVSTKAGFVYTAFVSDLYSARILGWETSSRANQDLVDQALKMAIHTRSGEGHPLPVGPGIPEEVKVIHHGDAGSVYTSHRYTENLQLEGLRPSVGTTGDAYDNACAESLIGLYKTEALRADSPFRTGPLTGLGDAQYVTAAWVHWYNNERIHTKAGNTTPIKAENQYHQNGARPRAAA